MARSLAASTTTATTTMPLWVAKTFRPALYAPDMRAFGVCRLVHANLHRHLRPAPKKELDDALRVLFMLE